MRSTLRSKQDVSPVIFILRVYAEPHTLAIALPTQSITIDKDAAAHTTKKKQTFEDLVSHLKHYNAGTRKGES